MAGPGNGLTFRVTILYTFCWQTNNLSSKQWQLEHVCSLWPIQASYYQPASNWIQANKRLYNHRFHFPWEDFGYLCIMTSRCGCDLRFFHTHPMWFLCLTFPISSTLRQQRHHCAPFATLPIITSGAADISSRCFNYANQWHLTTLLLGSFSRFKLQEWLMLIKWTEHQSHLVSWISTLR